MTSGRVDFWRQASRGILERPWLGWGFNGFGISYPYLIHWNRVPQKVLRLDDFSYDYIDQYGGPVITSSLPTYKAHNLILDTAISVGFLGLLTYSVLFCFYFWNVLNSPYRGFEAVAIAYLIFTLTWFECAQFTHIAWWALSLFSKNDQGSTTEVVSSSSERTQKHQRGHEKFYNAEPTGRNLNTQQ